MSMGERFGQYSGSSRALLPSSFTFCKITCTARRSDERVSDLPCQIFLGGPATHFQNLDIFGFSWLFGILFHVLVTFPCSLTPYLQNDTISTLVTYVKNSWPRTVSCEKCRSNLPFSPKTLFKGLHTTRLKSKDKSPQWHHTFSPSARKNKTTAKRFMASLFWNQKNVILICLRRTSSMRKDTARP